MARVVVSMLLLGTVVSAQEAFDQALKVYNSWIRRPSLNKRTRARERLAHTRDPRALEILFRSYGRPEAPKDFVRYLLVDIATADLDEAPHVGIYEEWRKQHGKREDAWLWYESLKIHLDVKGTADLFALARSRADIILRCAALEALRFADEQDPEVYGLVEELAKSAPSKPMVRAVLLESLTAILVAFEERIKTPEFGRACTAVLEQMDAPTTPMRTRIVMGRHMAKLFGQTYVWRNGRRWLQELKYRQHGGKKPNWRGYGKPPTFAGIEGHGDRFCYVIDMSDSMCKELTLAERERLPKGPITGARRRQKEARNDAWKKAFDQVDMRKVKNRFDAARELLKTSLLLLDEDKYFSVIWFGDKAGPLNSTKGMVKATLPNIKKVIAELDGIRPGSKTTERPWGTLRGATNIHGGMVRAFKLKGSGFAGVGEYVHSKTFQNGCDTIFLLSDGAPTWDDWPAQDSKDKGDQVGDPESGVKGDQNQQTLNFRGPFARALYLVKDVRRLNLFRKCEIHCVGMGEANMNTLERIAAVGKGQAVSLRGGKPGKSKPKGKPKN